MLGHYLSPAEHTRVPGVGAHMDDLPRCPKCGQPMKLIAFLPAGGGFPAIESFRCDECDAEITREVE